jgi:4-hydroxy-tetrahydrodipicolinate synthase
MDPIATPGPVLAGLYIPLVTPFADNGTLATDALEALAHAVLDDGAAGLVALGTTGEPATLTAAERRLVLDICARVCRERSATLIAGAGSNDTRASAAALGELAGWPEIRAALVAVPYYTRPGPDGVVAHFTSLAATSPVPLIVYHIPYRTGQSLDARTLLRLAAVPRIAGIKLAAGGIDEDTVAFMAHAPESFAVLAGDDAFASPLLALGAAGAILASAHLCTADFAELVAAWRAGHAVTARALGHRLSPLSAALFAEPNPTVIKAALHAQGRIPTPAVRLPLLPAGPETTAAALRAAQQRTCLTGS